MNLLKKLFSFSIGSIVALVIGIISTPLITRIIEPAEYGIATIFMTVGSLVTVVSLAGLDQAFVRFFYESNRVNLLKKSLSLSIGITAVISLLLYIFDDLFSSYISSDTTYALLMCLYIFAALIFRFSTLMLRMLQFGYRYSLIQAFQKVLDLVFVLSISFIFLPNRYALIFSSILTLLVLSLFTLLLAKSFWKQKGNEIRTVQYKELLAYSLPLLISSFMTILFQTLDKLYLNAWVSSEELGIYGAGFKLIAILGIIQSSFALFWAPVSLEHYKKHPEDHDFYGRMSKIITVVMMSVCIIVVMFKDILVLFLGPEYREASSVVAMLVLMPVMYTMSETTIQGVNFKFKSYLHIFISSFALAANILLCSMLIPKLGMQGAAISVALSYVVFYLARTYYGLKHYYFDNKIMQTLIMLACLIIWMITVIFTENLLIMIAGGLSLLVLLFSLFRQEIRESKQFFITVIKERWAK